MAQAQHAANFYVPAAVRWWRRPWMIPLVVLVGAFLIYVLPPYLSLNPEESRVTLVPGFRIHYGVVLTHVFAGTLAQLTVCLQVWTWLRERHPKAHRISGWIYVFGGVIPATLAGLVLSPFVVPHSGSVGTFVQGVLFIAVTIRGFVMGRQGRYPEHRRWMIYSFAFALATIWGRIFNLVVFGLFPHAITNLTVVSLVMEASTWIGWVANLIIAQWWLERTTNQPGWGAVRSSSPV